MIRNGLEYDRPYLERAFAELGDEEVSALVLLHDHRHKPLVRDLAIAAFDLESAPTFSYQHADVYCSRRIGQKVREGLKQRGNYSFLIVPSKAVGSEPDPGPFWINPGLARRELRGVSPLPFKGRFTYGMGGFVHDGRRVINAHSDSEIWLRAPAGATRIEWDHGMISAAWERAGDKSDGVELSIVGILPGHGEREIYRRWLDPVRRPEDRGLQREVISYQPLPGELLHFKTGPGGGYSYDWAFWERIEVK